MLRYASRRFALAVPTLVVITLFVFALLRVVPGGTAVALLGDDFTPEAAAEIEARLGLDKPLPLQYGEWMLQVMRGDLGQSLLDGRDISTLLARRAPVTIQLSVMTLALSVIIGVPIGLLAALKPDTVADYSFRSVAILGLAAPSFWLATMFLIYAANILNYSPPVFYQPPWENPGLNLQMMMWPALIGSVVGAAVIMRMTRAMMLEVVREDYIRTAYSKGLPQRDVILRHAMKNAMIPVVTIFGLSVANILSGSVIIETVFSLPGMGRLLVNATLARDLTVVQAIALISGVVVLVVNVIVDLTYAVLDPRLRYS